MEANGWTKLQVAEAILLLARFRVAEREVFISLLDGQGIPVDHALQTIANLAHKSRSIRARLIKAYVRDKTLLHPTKPDPKAKVVRIRMVETREAPRQLFPLTEDSSATDSIVPPKPNED